MTDTPDTDVSMVCECLSGCDCEEEAGPAAFLVMRKGECLSVCTRCHLNADQVLSVIAHLVGPPMLFLEYDALGFVALASHVVEDGDNMDGDNMES